MKNKLIYIFSLSITLLVGSCSKKELDVKNPNSPVPDDANTESGIKSLALGAIYRNGFNGITDSKYNGSWLGGGFWFLAPAYHDLLADVISSEAANNATNIVGVPDYVILDDGTKLTNTSPAKATIRTNNSRTKAGSNMYYFEWAWMYFMINGCNNILDRVENIDFSVTSGDPATKKNAVKAWAYWWKGFAYSRIGSIYYAGLIKDSYTTITTNNEYKSHDAIITEANANFDKAITALNAVTNATDFSTVLKALIPSQCQVGKGGALTTAMWIRNINTMKARNLLVNKRLADMTTTDWNNILILVNNGINSTDLVFTGRSASVGSFMSATTGSVAAMTSTSPLTSTYKISERLTQEYKPGDKRYTDNFTTAVTYLNQKGGITYSTRQRLLDGGATPAIPHIISSRSVGAYELYIAATYEENELMKAEANIKLGNIATGLAGVDAVRTYQGANLAAVSGVVTDPALAYEELRRERRVALIFRNVALYDARRWGVLDDITQGGGRTKSVVLRPSDGTINTNATINYNFLDYWDVPDDETSLNPPSATSAPVKNPK